ncbi:MAG: site-specific integrase [Promethearchaeota archaeon]|nr:MAG: site-specific integrase [Candidatus Lokiarchaeota archaeon]
METNELERDLLRKYKSMDRLSNGKKNRYEEYLKKWDWWNHEKNIKFVISVIGNIASEKVYYKKVPRYLNETKKWFRYLKSNPFYQHIFSQKRDLQIFDYLSKCDSLTFLSMYNDFNQNMGNPDEKSRNEWILLHQDYLPKSSHGFNKGKVILDYNWRLSHQGNLSKYWGFVRSDLRSLIRESWLNNRSDVGKSSKYEVIITKELLYDLLDNLPPIYQIIALFLAQTGLRISDAINCLVAKWDDLQYFSYNGKGRYYIPEVKTKKKNAQIHQIFISEELMLLLNYYVPEKCKNKIRFLLKRSDCYFPEIQYQVDFLRSKFNQNLKESFEKIKHLHLHVKPYQTIRAHLLRKYFITETDQVRKDLGEDYLRYIAGHKPLDPLYIIYTQHLRSVELNLKKFIDFIEPSVKIGFSQKKIEILSKRKLEIDKIFQLNFKKYLEDKIEKDYFSFIDILEFFLDNNYHITSDEITQLIYNMIQKGFIQRFGSYFSFNSEKKINNIKKEEIFHLKQKFSLRECKGLSFFELNEIILKNNPTKVKKDIFILLKKLLEINFLFVIDDMFYMN